MLTGTVKFYNRQKCFGFITPDNGSDDLFVSATALAASGLKTLEVGQRVSFESAGDPKGAKAVQIKLESVASPAPVAAPAPDRITLYYDPAIKSDQDVIAEVEAMGDGHRFIDYTATPPSHEELKRLSLLLRKDDQSLVRRYDPLFFELQLDDRFISETEFWTAIIEHPKLINGPVLSSGSRARVCKSKAEVQLFLENKERKQSKIISSRILAMINGQPLPPQIQDDEEEDDDVVLEAPAPQAAAPVKKRKTNPASPASSAKPARTVQKAPPAKKVKKAAKPAPARKKKAPISARKKK
jgi:CspA family cold shock protein